MNQDRDGGSRTPKSSSSSNPSGTHALRITIEPEQPAEPSAAASDEQAGAVPADAGGISDMPEAGHVAPPVSDELAAIAVAAELGEPVTVMDEPADEVVPAAAVEPEAANPIAAPAEAASVIMDEPSPAPVAQSHAAEPMIEAAASTEPEPVRETLAETAAKHEQTAAAADEMSYALSLMMDDARHDAALIGRKLMEFVQANFENNIEMARDYAGARSVPEIVNVHTAYVRRQIDLLSRQAEEFRTLTSDLTAKRVSKIQSRLKA